MDKKWVLVVIALLIVVLVYNFITTVFKNDEEEFAHGRIFVDYTSRKPKRYVSSKYNYSNMNQNRHNPYAYKSAQEARKIQRTMFAGLVKATTKSYDSYMAKALKGMPSPRKSFPKPHSTPQYEKILALYDQPLPPYQSGLTYFGKGDYQRALKNFNRALESVDKEDIKHRIDIYSMIAECYLNLKNSNGYTEYKVKEVRMNRKLKRVLEQVFPSQKNSFKQLDWSTTQEASKRMLKIRSMAARMKSNRGIEGMLLRAKLDLEVSRRVSH